MLSRIEVSRAAVLVKSEELFFDVTISDIVLYNVV